MNQRLVELLSAEHAKYERVTHPGAVTAQEQAAASHISGWSLAKVLIVKERDGYVMAVLPACCALDLNRLKGLIGHGPVRLATVEEIYGAIPDCVPGTIPPFGALWGLRTFADRSLLNVGEVTMPAGDPATAIRMPASEFERLAKARIGDFAVPETLLPTHTAGR
ncbi:MAG TPA: YbaK/EbsC family protein [Methylomirabilota bacterium]|nr:YbaK/EbsC family protein [Methylomirabilota bacterium]